MDKLIKYFKSFFGNKALPLKNNVSNNLYLYILEHKLALVKLAISDITVFEYKDHFDMYIDSNKPTQFHDRLKETLSNTLSYSNGKQVNIIIVDTEIWKHF